MRVFHADIFCMAGGEREQNFALSCLMTQFASSLAPNEDGSYNPWRWYADLVNFVCNGLFVVELGIRCVLLLPCGSRFCSSPCACLKIAACSIYGGGRSSVNLGKYLICLL
jgi:hypothetical protein